MQQIGAAASRAAFTVASSPSLFKRVFLPALLLFAVTFVGTRLLTDREFRGLFDPAFLSELWRVGRVMNRAHQNYLHPHEASYQRLGDAALDHMLDGLDPYSDYLAPAQYDELRREGDQQLVGVGIELERRNGRVQITRVFPSSPAADKRWQAGDRLATIGDTDVRDRVNAAGLTLVVTVENVRNLLRGTEDSTVRVTRERPSDAKTFTDILQRQNFDIPSVREADLRADGIGYLRLTQFGRHSGAELGAVVRELQQQGMKGLVLDLRDNPGGLLDAVAPVLSALLSPGEKVATTRGGPAYPRTRPIRVPESSTQNFRGPLAVLVNENTASAAEIVAGALQDARRAAVVGVRTVGKGVVQQVVGLPDGGGVRLTTEEYYLPVQGSIHQRGITPDVEVPLSPDEWALLRIQRADLRNLLPAAAPEALPTATWWESDVRAQQKRRAAAQFAARYGFTPRPDPQLETAVALVLAAARAGK